MAAARETIGLSFGFRSSDDFPGLKIDLVIEKVKAIRVKIPEYTLKNEVQELNFAYYRWGVLKEPSTYSQLDLNAREIANFILKVGEMEIPCVRPEICKRDERYMLLLTYTNYSLKAEIVKRDIFDQAALNTLLKGLLTPLLDVTISQFLDRARPIIEEASSGILAALLRALFDAQETKACNPKEMLNQFIQTKIEQMTPDARHEFLVAIRTIEELKKSLITENSKATVDKILNRMCLRNIGIEAFEMMLRSILKALAGDYQDADGIAELIDRAWRRFSIDNFSSQPS